MRFWLNKIDNPTHPSIGVLTHAIAFRPIFLKQSREKQRAHLNRITDPERRERQESVYREGLDAPVVEKAIRTLDKFIHDMEAALKLNNFICGPKYSLADAAATPYINRLSVLKLLDVWADEVPHVLEWYRKIRLRRSFKMAIQNYLTETDKNQFLKIDSKGAEKARSFLRDK